MVNTKEKFSYVKNYYKKVSHHTPLKVIKSQKRTPREGKKNKGSIIHQRILK